MTKKKSWDKLASRYVSAKKKFKPGQGGRFKPLVDASKKQRGCK